jgi:Domain of unknown function (DUF927)
MTKKSKKTSISTTANSATRIIAKVNEPNDAACDPSAEWLVRLQQNELCKEFEIAIRFYTRMGERRIITIPARDRADFTKIFKELCAHDARLPTSRALSLQFVETLIQATPTIAMTVVSRPGFRDGAMGFVMPICRYGSAKGRFIWDKENCDPAFGEIKGELENYSEGVLTPALASPYATFAILIALAAPLQRYCEQRGHGKLLPEGAIFHFACDSSSGKTTLARLAQSVFGSPDVQTDYEVTPRGAAEAAYARNDLVLVLDDTKALALPDAELLRVMKLFAQRIPSGRSKAISRVPGKRAYPQLSWFCFAISTGPETLAEIAHRTSSKRFGDRVRFLEMTVPPGDKGGIFGAPLRGIDDKVENPADLLDEIELTIAENHGVLFHAWVKFLLSADQCERIRALVAEFVATTAGGQNGLEIRFARKFGVIYAAGLIGVEAGLLPWSPDWVSSAVRYCYDQARNTRDPDAAAVEEGLKAIGQALETESRFPQHNSAQRTPPLFPDDALGLRIVKGKKYVFQLCPDRLDLVGIMDLKRIMEKAKEQGLIIASENETPSVQIRVRTPEGQVKKLRFWRISRDRTLKWLEQRARTLGGQS